PQLRAAQPSPYRDLNLYPHRREQVFEMESYPAMSSNPSVDAKKPPFLGLWLKAMRVPFLQATFVPVILGGVVAWETVHVFSWSTFLLTLLGASLIQIASNMFNDYFDF